MQMAEKACIVYLPLLSQNVFRYLFFNQFYETRVFLRLSTVRNVGGGGGGKGGEEETRSPFVHENHEASPPHALAALGKGVQMANSEFAIRHLLFQKKSLLPLW